MPAPLSPRPVTPAARPGLFGMSDVCATLSCILLADTAFSRPADSPTKVEETEQIISAHPSMLINAYIYYYVLSTSMINVYIYYHVLSTSMECARDLFSCLGYYTLMCEVMTIS